MDKIIKNILKKLEDDGFKAYLVGGFVRDYLLGIKSNDIDICTNALPKDIHRLFPSYNKKNDYGGFNLKIKNYNIDITTFRKELKYENRRPTELIYIDDLNEDIKRRDFTINSICMDKDEQVIDLVNGVNDLNNFLIKMNGNIKERLIEDPLRILRAIRFSCTLNFNIEDNLLKEIKDNYQLINTLSKDRIKGELNKILLSPNYNKGLSLLKELKILDLLNIKYDDITYVSDLCGMWSQLEFSSYFTFTKQEKRNIIKIRQIINKGYIDNKILFTYGLYTSLVAGQILNISKKKINKMFNDMPIQFAEDLDITSEEIMTILKIKPSEKIKKIKRHLINKILDGKLENKNKILINYLKNRQEGKKNE